MPPDPNTHIPHFPNAPERAFRRQGCNPAQPIGLRSRTAFALVIVVLLFGMGNAQAKDPGTPTAAHLGLTPAYLQGDWCNTHFQFPNERTEENTPYRWDPDGTYATRGAATAPMRSGYFYLYKPDGKIKLATIAGFYKVKSVEPDAFVLRVIGDMHFQRGTCK